MKIKFSKRSTKNLREIYDHIKHDDYDTAAVVVGKIKHKISNLSFFPFLGIPGRARNTREYFIPRLPYFAVYKVLEKEIVIVTIQHDRQNYTS